MWEFKDRPLEMSTPSTLHLLEPPGSDHVIKVQLERLKNIMMNKPTKSGHKNSAYSFYMSKNRILKTNNEL